jgi:TetR/AcrR family transcriptional repressor of nem operon
LNWEDAAAYLESLLQHSAKPLDALRRYPETFRWALENDNRICLCSLCLRNLMTCLT